MLKSHRIHQNNDTVEKDAGSFAESRAGTAGKKMAELITKANILSKSSKEKMLLGGAQ